MNDVDSPYLYNKLCNVQLFKLEEMSFCGNQYIKNLQILILHTNTVNYIIRSIFPI